MHQYCFLHFADFLFQKVFNFKNFSHVDHYLSNAILLLLLLFRIHLLLLLLLLLLVLLIFIIINIISNSILCPIKQKEKRKKISLPTMGK